MADNDDYVRDDRAMYERGVQAERQAWLDAITKVRASTTRPGRHGPWWDGVTLDEVVRLVTADDTDKETTT